MACVDKSRVEPTIFFIEKISFSLKVFSGYFYGQSFIKTVRGPLVCATSKASDHPAHTRSLIRAFASRLSILWLLSYWLNTICSLSLKGGCRGSSESTLVKMSNCWKFHAAVNYKLLRVCDKTIVKGVCSAAATSQNRGVCIAACIWAEAWDFQQFGILTSVDSDEPLHPLFKLKNSK